MKLLNVLALVVIAFVMGCASKELNPNAKLVRLTKAEPKGCKFLGDVIGEQGGSFFGKMTSNKNLQLGALNDIKNQTHELGGNVVYVISDRAGNTGSAGQYGGSFEQTDVTMMGQAYRCSEKVAE